MSPRIDVVEHEPGAPLGRMADWLREQEIDVVVHRPYAGDQLPHGDSLEALIVLGGQPGAYDDERVPWLPSLRELISDVVDTETPLLGICLGAQLLAVAVGGEVQRSQRGPEIGVVEVELTDEAFEDALAGQLPGPYKGFSYHYDEVTKLPPHAVRLGGTAEFPNQLFRVGTYAWGIQSHPEVAPARFLSWMNRDVNGLPTDERALTRRRVAELDEVLQSHGQAVAYAFARVVKEATAVGLDPA